MSFFGFGKKDPEEDEIKEETDEIEDDSEDCYEFYGTNDKYLIVRNGNLELEELFLKVEEKPDYKLISVFESESTGWVFVLEKKDLPQ